MNLAKILGFEAISVSGGFLKENWPIFQNFLLKYLENLENFEKIHFRFCFFEEKGL